MRLPGGQACKTQALPGIDLASLALNPTTSSERWRAWSELRGMTPDCKSPRGLKHWPLAFFCSRSDSSNLSLSTWFSRPKFASAVSLVLVEVQASGIQSSHV